MTELVERLCLPADRVRVRALRAGGSVAARVVTDRETRVCLFFLGLLLSAASFAIFLPLWSLALGPILLGVAHVLSDVRYLVLKPRIHQRRTFALAAVPLVLVSLGAGLSVGLLAPLILVLGAEAPLKRRALFAAALLLTLIVATRWRHASHLAFVHAHNFIAVLFWFIWRARAKRLYLIPLAALGALTLLFIGGAFDPLVAGVMSSPSQSAPTIADHLAQLAPNVPGMLGLRLVLLFAFMQSVHYGVWLRLVPEEARDRPTPRTFRSSYHALQKDFGVWLPVFLIAAIVIVGWALFDLASARAGYLRLAGFHGYLELAVLMLFMVERRGLNDRLA